MLDIQLLKKDVEHVSLALKSRGYKLEAGVFQDLETRRKEIQTKTQNLQAERNRHSKQIGLLKKNGEDAKILMDKMSINSLELKKLESDLSALQIEVKKFLSEIPNVPHQSVPAGSDEKDNKLIREVGDVPYFDFPIKDHVDIGHDLGLLGFEIATKISGARFSILNSDLARMHRALVNFMIDVHTVKHGYTELYVPYLVNANSVFGTGQLPKFEKDLFSIEREDGGKWYLIPTAEVPVTNMVRDQIIDKADLPLKYVCHTPCFRSEAGSYGRDTRGMIRQHQFDKVELVQVCSPEKSYDSLEMLTTHAEEILKQLGLAYRVMLLSSGDMGFSAAKTYDLEVWLPSQKCYREISSCSNFESFQARRMMSRYKKPGGKPDYVHTLNGSGLAVGRTLVAIMENYQDEDGSIVIPEILRKYMGGMTKVSTSEK